MNGFEQEIIVTSVAIYGAVVVATGIYCWLAYRRLTK